MTYYEKWEKRLMEAADAENPEQALIQACSDIFGPMFFINMQLQMSSILGELSRYSSGRLLEPFLEMGQRKSTAVRGRTPFQFSSDF